MNLNDWHTAIWCYPGASVPIYQWRDWPVAIFWGGYFSVKNLLFKTIWFTTVLQCFLRMFRQFSLICVFCDVWCVTCYTVTDTWTETHPLNNLWTGLGAGLKTFSVPMDEVLQTTDNLLSEEGQSLWQALQINHGNILLMENKPGNYSSLSNKKVQILPKIQLNTFGGPARGAYALPQTS